MKQGQNILRWMTDSLELSGEPVPGQSLIEIADTNRVLIENHCGIREYSPERIGVLVKFGCIDVCGCNLELTQMTKEQLLISGVIGSVILHRRNLS